MHVIIITLLIKKQTQVCRFQCHIEIMTLCIVIFDHVAHPQQAERKRSDRAILVKLPNKEMTQKANFKSQCVPLYKRNRFRLALGLL